MVIILHLEKTENLPLIKRILSSVILYTTDEPVDVFELWVVDPVDEIVDSVDGMVGLLVVDAGDEMVELWVVVSVNDMAGLWVDVATELVCEKMPVFEYKSEPIETIISESWKIFEYKIQVPVFMLIEFFWYTIVKQFVFKLQADKQKKNPFFVDDSIKYCRSIVLSTS